MRIIFNPVAGGRRAAALWRVLDLLTLNGVAVEVAETHYAGHATALAREMAQAGERLVVAAGGDGTIAEVAGGLAGSCTALGVIPLGTANVLAREYGLPTHPRAIAHILAYKRTRPLWPGIAHFAQRDHVFVQMLGMGFDAAVVHHLSRPLKRLLGRGAYVWEGLHQSFAYDFPPIRLRLDGTLVEAASVIITKGRYYGGRFLLAPHARPGEPGFQVALFEERGTLAALNAGAALPLGLLPCTKGVRLLPAREIEFPLPPRVLLTQADGDALPGTPLRVTNATVPISLITG